MPSRGSGVTRVINSRRMRWTGHVARGGEKRNICMVLKSKGNLPRGILMGLLESNIERIG
jgi:hypothetical protein